MSSKKWIFRILVAFMISMPAAASFAVDADPSQEAAQVSPDAAPEAAPETEAAPAVPEAAPVLPEAAPEPAPVTPPALKPITITFSGDLSAVSSTDTPPMITVQDRYGVKKEISVPAEAKIAQGGSAKALTDLKTGDKLTVEYTYDVATGKRTAQSISIGEASPANP